MSASKARAVQCTECSTVMHYNNIDRHWKNQHKSQYAHITREPLDHDYRSLMFDPTDKPLTRQKQKRAVPQAKPVKKPVASKRVVALAPLSARDVTHVVWEHVQGVGAPVPLALLDKVLAFTQSTHEFMEAIKP